MKKKVKSRTFLHGGFNKHNKKSFLALDKSPKNSRIISDQARFFRIYRNILKIFIVGSFILTVIIVGRDLQSNIQEKQAIDSQKEKLTKELVFWKDFVAKHKNYRDAYFKMSILEYKLGNESQAKVYLKEGLSLDPNSENGKKIEDFISK